MLFLAFLAGLLFIGPAALLVGAAGSAVIVSDALCTGKRMREIAEKAAKEIMTDADSIEVTGSRDFLQIHRALGLEQWQPAHPSADGAIAGGVAVDRAAERNDSVLFVFPRGLTCLDRRPRFSRETLDRIESMKADGVAIANIAALADKNRPDDACLSRTPCRSG